MSSKVALAWALLLGFCACGEPPCPRLHDGLRPVISLEPFSWGKSPEPLLTMGHPSLGMQGLTGLWTPWLE